MAGGVQVGAEWAVVLLAAAIFVSARPSIEMAFPMIEIAFPMASNSVSLKDAAVATGRLCYTSLGRYSVSQSRVDTHRWGRL